jgi:hypothetical protein
MVSHVTAGFAPLAAGDVLVQGLERAGVLHDGGVAEAPDAPGPQWNGSTGTPPLTVAVRCTVTVAQAPPLPRAWVRTVVRGGRRAGRTRYRPGSHHRPRRHEDRALANIPGSPGRFLLILITSKFPGSLFLLHTFSPLRGLNFIT